LLLLARTFLNPGRSFANLLAFRKPWHRFDRLGLFGEDFRIRRELLADYKTGGEKPFDYVRPSNVEFEHSFPKEACIELTALLVYEPCLGVGSCVGGGGSGASRVTPSLQSVAEVSGCLIMHMPAANQSGDSLFYGGGLRWTPLAARRVSPYMQ